VGNLCASKSLSPNNFQSHPILHGGLAGFEKSKMRDDCYGSAAMRMML
jgi:hypothetical protein